MYCVYCPSLVRENRGADNQTINSPSHQTCIKVKRVAVGGKGTMTLEQSKAEHKNSQSRSSRL